MMVTVADIGLVMEIESFSVLNWSVRCKLMFFDDHISLFIAKRFLIPFFC